MLFIGIFLLSGNLVLASVPRCSLVKEVWTSLQTAPTETVTLDMSCHQPAPKAPQTGPTLGDPGLCQCHLASCLVFTLPTLVSEHDVRFIPNSERVLIFPVAYLIARTHSEVEGPPPRA